MAWLDDLTCAIRIDRPGLALVDYHTINPLPRVYEDFEGINAADRGLVPLGTTLQARSGQAPRWFAGTVPAVTTRHYLQDAAFLLLLDGPAEALAVLADAVTHPTWTLQLGRKGCTPAHPVLLGSADRSLVDVARTAPTMTPTPVDELDLVWLRGTPTADLAPVRTRAVLDLPLGTHPQHGYASNQHTVTRITVLTETPAQARDHSSAALLAWAATHLAHPARDPQEITS